MSASLLVLGSERAQKCFQGDLSVQPGDATMRANYAVAVVTVILVGFGAKLYFFPPTAEADEPDIVDVRMDVLKMHENVKLPTQNIDDKTFVFADGD
jgi:hypothetical protein